MSDPKAAFLHAGQPDWASLETDPAVDADAEKARVARVQDSVHDELALIANAENLVILAGLGTSIGVKSADGKREAPKMSDLWGEVEKLPSFKAIESKLTPAVVSGKNLEHILSDAQARAALDPSEIPLATFIKEAENIVWDRCSFVDSDSKLESHETFLRKAARRSTRLQRTQIFTTNYDLAFETAAIHSRFNVIDGFGYGSHAFDGSSFDLDFVRRYPNEPPTLEPNVFHLLKLHGSVDWDSADGRVRKSGAARPASPVLIYPSAAKFQLSYEQPYLEFMSRFQIALRQPDVGLIVVGFGFNDAHIVAPIEAALRSNIGLRAVAVAPHADAINAADTYKEFTRLIKLGDRRLSLLKGTFDDLVRLLPDVPPLEERDAHNNRFHSTPRKAT